MNTIAPESKNIFQIPSKDKSRRLEEACYGNSLIGLLLNYFMYGAETEIKYRGAEEGCKVVVLRRTHEDIMVKLPFKVSRKTLIRYLGLLNEYGYVTSEPYSRDFAVHGDKVQEALSSPPVKSKRPDYDRHPQKGCRSTTFQPLGNDNVVASEKVVDLQQKVVTLQLNVVVLQQKVVELTTLQPYIKQLVELAEGHKFDPYITNRTITEYTEEDSQISSETAMPTVEANASQPLVQSLFDRLDEKDKQIAEMQAQLQALTERETLHANTASPSPETGPTSATTDSGHGLHRTPSNVPAAPGPTPSTDVQEVTQTTFPIDIEATDETVGSTGKRAEKGIESKAIGKIEVPAVTPSKDVPWNAEKLVQITEEKRFVRGKQGARFSEVKQGKTNKSQRDRQLDAAKKIIALGITEEQYSMAYDDRNDDWWNAERGSLTVEVMFASTPRKISRVIELVEKIESSGSCRIIPFQAKPIEQQKPQPMRTMADLSRRSIKDMKIL